MAQQPRQQRIGIYGKFTAPALDTSESDKMRALAGLGQTVGDTAVALGKPFAEAKGAKEGTAAAKEAFKTGAEVETKSFGYSADSFNQAATKETSALQAAAKSSALLEADQTLSDLETQYANDSQGFISAATGFSKGASQDPDYQRYLLNQRISAGARIAKNENANNIAQAKTIYYQDVVNSRTSILNKLYSGDPDSIEQALEQYETHVENLKGFRGVIESSILEGNLIKFKEDMVEAQLLGLVNHQYINNPELDPDQRAAAGKQYLSEFNNTDITDITPKQKLALREKIEKAFSDAASRDKQDIIDSSNATMSEQNQNALTFDEKILYNNVLSSQQKLLALSEMRLNGELDTDQVTARENVINRVTKLEDTTVKEVENNIVQLAYDAVSLTDESEYLQAQKNVYTLALEEYAAGRLLYDDYEKIKNQLDNLLTSKTSQVTAVMGASQLVEDKITNSLGPEYKGDGIRFLFFNAEPEIKRLNDELKAAYDEDNANKTVFSSSLPQKLTPIEKEEIYIKYSNQFIEKTKSDNKQRSDSILSQQFKNTAKSKIPVVASRYEHKKLRPGDKYYLPGDSSEYTKQ